MMKIASSENRRESGFSLLELLIAMVIFIIITASVYGLMEVGRIDRNRSSRRADILKNARVAIHLIGRDALNAGLGFNRAGAVTPDNFVSTTLGVPADADTDRDLLTSIVAGNNLYTNNLATDPTVRTDSVAFCYRDMDFNTGDLIKLSNVASPAGSPSVPRIQTQLPTGASQASLYQLYLVESDTTQVAIMATAINGTDRIDAAPGDPLGLNQPLDGTGSGGSVLRQCIDQNDQNCTTYVATMKRFFLVNYRVRPDGTLVRVIYGNNPTGVAGDQVQEQPLAYNVEDLQIEYVLEDGTVTGAPNAGPDGIVGTGDDFTDGFNLVRQVTVRIRVQATESDEQTGQANSLSLTATFSARNMEYDAG